MEKVVPIGKVVLLIEQGETKVNIENLLKTLNVGDMKARVIALEDVDLVE